MNLLFHQLRTDFTRQRWWFLSLALLFVGMVVDVFPCEILFIVGWLLLLLELLQADRLLISHAFWQTRPFGRRGFIGIKLAMVLLSFVLLHVLVTFADWWRYDLQWDQALRGAGALVFLSGGIYLFIAAGAAQSKSRRDFFLFVLLGFLVFIATVVVMTKWRIRFPDFYSFLLSLNAAALVTAVLCWWLGPVARKERSTFGVWLLGIAISVLAACVWPLGLSEKPQFEAVDVAVRVLEGGQRPAEDEDYWFRSFAVRPGEGLQSRLLGMDFIFRDQSLQAAGAYPSLRRNRNRKDDVRTIKARYSQNTRWIEPQYGDRAANLDPGEPLAGKLHVEVFRWSATEMGEPAVGVSAPAHGGGYFKIEGRNSHDASLSLKIMRLHPGQIRSQGQLPQAYVPSSEFPERIYVLYHPGLDMAIRATGSGYADNAPTTTLALVFHDNVEFFIPQVELSLLGISVDEWVAESRLDIYERDVVGRSWLPFSRGDEVEEGMPELLPPVVTKPTVTAPNMLVEALREGRVDVLRHRLKNRVPLSGHVVADVFRVLASQSATEDEAKDLEWHFIHAQGGQSGAVEALAQCQHVDTGKAILAAWKRWEFGFFWPYGLPSFVNDQGALAPYAARYGNREGLRQTVGIVTGTNNEAALRELRRGIPFEGNDDAFKDWILERWETLTWNDRGSVWE